MNSFKRCLPYVSSMAFVCLSSSIFAGEWQVNPYAKATAKFDDNVRFVADNPEDTFKGIIELGAFLQNDSEAVKTTLSPRISFSGYSSQSDLNSDEQVLDFSTRAIGERSSPSLNIRLSRDSTLTSELEDAGYVSVNKQRTRWFVNPAWSYRLTQRDALNLSLQVQSISYDDVVNERLFDYDYQTARLAYVRTINESIDFSTRLYQSQYVADRAGRKADVTGIEAGVSNKFNERTRGSIYVGGNTTDTETDGQKESNSGFTMSAAIDYRTELQKISAGLSRAVLPSSAGDVRNDDTLKLDYDRRVNEVMGWGIDFLFQQRKPVSDNDSSVAERDYYYLGPYLTWKLSQEWKLTGSYRISFQKFDQGDSDADRNELGLSIEYRKPTRSSD